MEEEFKKENVPTSYNKLKNFEEVLARQRKEIEERRMRVYENLKRERNISEHKIYSSLRSQPERKITEKIEDREEKRKKQLQNEALAQDIELKKTTLNRLFILLFGETIIVFILITFQGFGWYNFYLEEWSFKLLIVATISQITLMLKIAVKHLFPEKKSSK